MKRIIAFLFAAMMILGMSTSALANATVESSYSLDGNIYFNSKTGTFAYREEYGEPYQIMDAKGNALTEPIYEDISVNSGYFEITVGEGMNNVGALDGQGKPVIPVEYGDIDYIGGKWIAGIKMVEATVDNYDYKSYSQDDVYYLVGQVDFYFDGKLVGTLSRTEYEYADDYGDYLCVKSRENKYSFYNKEFVKSEYPENDYLSEFEKDYSSGVITHVGSNQAAFCATCTLTSAEVTQDVYVDNRIGKDLQGNILFDLTGIADYCGEFEGNYARIEKDDKYGLIDKTGAVIIPCEYDAIPVVSYSEYPYLHQGYQPVVKDKKMGIVDMNGNLVYLSRYDESVVSTYYFPFMSAENTDGQEIVISIAGEFQEHFPEARFYGNAQIFTAKRDDGSYVVLDISGNEVIPPITGEDYVSFNVSDDGSVLVVNYDGINTVYNLKIDGNFTPLGDLPSLDCAGCGYHTDDVSFNFCPMCGVQFEK